MAAFLAVFLSIVPFCSGLFNLCGRGLASLASEEEGESWEGDSGVELEHEGVDVACEEGGVAEFGVEDGEAEAAGVWPAAGGIFEEAGEGDDGGLESGVACGAEVFADGVDVLLESKGEAVGSEGLLGLFVEWAADGFLEEYGASAGFEGAVKGSEYGVEVVGVVDGGYGEDEVEGLFAEREPGHLATDAFETVAVVEIDLAEFEVGADVRGHDGACVPCEVGGAPARIGADFDDGLRSGQREPVEEFEVVVGQGV